MLGRQLSRADSFAPTGLEVLEAPCPRAYALGYFLPSLREGCSIPMIVRSQRSAGTDLYRLCREADSWELVQSASESQREE